MCSINLVLRLIDVYVQTELQATSVTSVQIALILQDTFTKMADALFVVALTLAYQRNVTQLLDNVRVYQD